MSLLASRIVRSKINVRARFGATALVDVATNSTIESVRGNATIFQFGFFDHLSAVYDLSEVESLTLKIQPSQTPGGSTLVSQTLAAAALDLTLDATTWGNETKQHAVFSFTNAQMNFTIGATRKSFWLVITAILTDGKEVTLAGGDFILHEDNNATAGVPDENPGTAITLEQADARYPRAIARTEAQGPPVNEGWPEQYLIDLSGIFVDTAGNADFQVLTDLNETFVVALADTDDTPALIGAKIIAVLNADASFAAVHLAEMIGGMLSIKYLTNVASATGTGYFELSASATGGCEFDGGPYVWSDPPAYTASGIISGQTVADGLGQRCYVGDRPGPFRSFEATHIDPTIWQEITAGHLINTTTGDTQKIVISGAADSEILTITDL
jgi:hypothetical protein